MVDADENVKYTFESSDLKVDLSDKIAEILRKEVKPSIESPAVYSKTVRTSKEKGTEEIIKSANNKFLIDVLSPEIKENEKKKREHKDKLMRAVSLFLTGQFIIVALVVSFLLIAVVYCHVKSNPFSNGTIQIFFTFVGAYITSVIVELIAILRCIVTNVFDTSISGLVKVFKDE